MNETVTAAALLRHAADLVDEVARNATPGSWNGHTPTEALPSGVVYGGPWEHGYRTGTVMAWCEEAVTEYGGEPSTADLEWLCLMSPHIAAPLAAWLRAEADRGPTGPALRFARMLVTGGLTDDADDVRGEVTS